MAGEKWAFTGTAWREYGWMRSEVESLLEMTWARDIRGGASIVSPRRNRWEPQSPTWKDWSGNLGMGNHGPTGPGFQIPLLYMDGKHWRRRRISTSRGRIIVSWTWTWKWPLLESLTCTRKSRASVRGPGTFNGSLDFVKMKVTARPYYPEM